MWNFCKSNNYFVIVINGTRATMWKGKGKLGNLCSRSFEETHNKVCSNDNGYGKWHVGSLVLRMTMMMRKRE